MGKYRWDEIASYNELELFRMAFPEEYVDWVMLPLMNVLLRNPLSLGEFYKWLGSNFFIFMFSGDHGPASMVVEGANFDVRRRPLPAKPHHDFDAVS